MLLKGSDKSNIDNRFVPCSHNPVSPIPFFNCKNGDNDIKNIKFESIFRTSFIHSFTKWTPMMSDDDMNVNSEGFDASTVTVFSHCNISVNNNKIMTKAARYNI